MGVDEGNIQVMDGCRNCNGKLSNNYSYGIYLQVGSNYGLQVKEFLRCHLFSLPGMFVCISHSYILHLFVTAGGMRERTASGSGIHIHGFFFC